MQQPRPKSTGALVPARAGRWVSSYLRNVLGEDAKPQSSGHQPGAGPRAASASISPLYARARRKAQQGEALVREGFSTSRALVPVGPVRTHDPRPQQAGNTASGSADSNPLQVPVFVGGHLGASGEFADGMLVGAGLSALVLILSAFFAL